MASLPTTFPAKRAVFVQKWAGFVSAIWLTIFSGCYVFPNYSSALKQVLGINQKLLNGISIAEDVGDSFGGIIAGILSNHFPVWALFCISASTAFLGYGVEWLVVSQSISPLPYWVMILAATAAGSTPCWMNVAIFNASVRNFIRNRGPVAGLFKANMGLSAAVFVAFCDTLFSNSASAYLLMLTIIPTTFSLISAIFFRPVSSAETQEEEQAEQTSLRIFNTMACGLAVYIASLTFLPTDLKESNVYKVMAIVILLAILGAPALVPLVLLSEVKETEDLGANHNQVVSSFEELEVDDDDDDDDEKGSPPLHDHDCHVLLDKAVSNGSGNSALCQPLLDASADGSSAGKFPGKTLPSKLAEWSCCGRLPSWSFWRVEELGEDKPTLSLFKTWHYYVLYLSLFCGCGSCVAYSSNLSQVGQSLGYNNTNLFASLFSLGNFSGRLASGNISEYFLRAKDSGAWRLFGGLSLHACMQTVDHVAEEKLWERSLALTQAPSQTCA
ncbi:hypothetical protein GOP47_0029903 [Adiantum capillus-veneris]|nr:hypothetical protein GOP47_0029903 [Adiantum capillus-veneris]